MNECGEILKRIILISTIIGKVVIAKFKPSETIPECIGALMQGDILLTEPELIALVSQLIPIGMEAVQTLWDICIREQHKYKAGGHFPCYDTTVLDMGPVQSVIKILTQLFLKLKKLSGIDGIQFNTADDTGRAGGQRILFFKSKHVGSLLDRLLQVGFQ